MKNVFKRFYAWLGARADKALHFLVCFTLIVLFALVFSLEHFWVGAVLALALSILKELLDEWVYKGADIKDLVADAIGILVACAFCLAVIVAREAF